MNVPSGNALIVYTDLDGTLLDHNSYSFEPALEALRLLKLHNIPLILASSKTACEIERIREALGFQHCEAIVENGAGLLMPGDAVNRSQDIYEALLKKINEVSPEYRDNFKGFSQFSVEELSGITGLGHDETQRAKTRQFSEPGIWSGSEEAFADFCTTLRELGISVQKGGRFITLSFGANKSQLVNKITDMHRTGMEKRFAIALGDAPNDISMLETADLGIIIPNPSHNGIDKLSSENTGKIIRAPFSGPEGWNFAVLDVLRCAGLGA